MKVNTALTARQAKDHQAATVASGQHGVITRSQALAAGLKRGAIARRVRSGRWQLLRPGVYSITGAPKSRRRELVEACLAAGPRAVVSKFSAAELYDFDDVWKRSRPHVSVLHQDKRKPKAVSVRRARSLEPCDIQVLDGVRVTTPLRTVLDLVEHLPRKSLELTLMDAVRRKLIDPVELVARVETLRGSGRKGFAKLRFVLETENFRQHHESRLEARALQVIIDAGFPRPVSPYTVMVNGAPVAQADFAYLKEKIVILCDGLKYHSVTDRMASDKRQRDILKTAGWKVVVPVWADVIGKGTQLKTDLQKAFQAARNTESAVTDTKVSAAAAPRANPFSGLPVPPRDSPALGSKRNSRTAPAAATRLSPSSRGGEGADTGMGDG